jgi:hypothetical protein
MDNAVILFLDDDSHRAALMYQRMTPEDQSRTIWVTKAEEAIEVLTNYKSRLDRVYLDHDLGGETYVHSGREDCGMEVVRFLEKQNPSDYTCRFIVHSWNIDAAKKMTDRLDKVGYQVEMKPFGM